MSFIKENFSEVVERIEKSAEKSGRKCEDVRLVTVTKTIDTERIKEAISAGATILGENRVQEILEKYDELSALAKFHLIGHLQKNKVKYIIGKVELIHSVESLSLASEIDKKAKKEGIVQKILIEVNVSGEESKFGIKPCDAEEFVREASKYENVKIEGLMTVAPFDANEDELRAVFKGLRELAERIDGLNIDRVSMKELSMGMTGDYELAIEEGATMVRVGTGIFGKRDYSK